MSSIWFGVVIVIIIAFKDAIQDFLQSPHSATNCLQHVCTLKWLGRSHVQIMCNTSSAYHVQVSCYIPWVQRDSSTSKFSRV